MTKNEFIAVMERQLIRLPKADRDDILSDYEDHFARGMAEGKTEEQVCADIGDPDELALTYLENLPDGSKGAPYVPAQEPQQAEAPTYQPPVYGAQDAAQNAPYVQQTQPTRSFDRTTSIVIVVLLSLFIAAPVVFMLVQTVLGLFGAGIGFGVASIAFLVSGVLGTSVGVAVAIGVLLMSIGFLAFGGLFIVGGIALIKCIIIIIKWYVGECKKIIEEGRF